MYFLSKIEKYIKGNIKVNIKYVKNTKKSWSTEIGSGNLKICVCAKILLSFLSQTSRFSRWKCLFEFILVVMD